MFHGKSNFPLFFVAWPPGRFSYIFVKTSFIIGKMSTNCQKMDIFSKFTLQILGKNQHDYIAKSQLKDTFDIPSIHPIHPIPSHPMPSHPIRKLGPLGLGCRSALHPEGILKVLTRKLRVLRVSAHEFVFFQIFAQKGLPSRGENKKWSFR